MSLERFPKLAAETIGRKVFFEEPPEYIHALVERGYEVVLLATLPRRDSNEEREYLRAKLQGVEEGTIKTDKVLLAALQAAIALEFGPKATFTSAEPKAQDSLDELLDWKPTRHTLKGNTTIQHRDPLDDLVKETN